MSPHEDFITACKLEASQVKQLLETHEKAKSLTDRAAGWHNFDDIQTMEGLKGRFLWSEDLLGPAVINFKFDPNRIGSFGTYTLTRAGTTAEQGEFYSVPNNPAIGWAAIILTPQGTSNSRPFFVGGMMTDEKRCISILILNKLGAHGPTLPPFSAVRMP